MNWVRWLATTVVGFFLSFFAGLQGLDLSTWQAVKVAVMSAALQAVAHVLPSPLKWEGEAQQK